jgi:hypothetical protein
MDWLTLSKAGATSKIVKKASKSAESPLMKPMFRVKISRLMREFHA